MCSVCEFGFSHTTYASLRWWHALLQVAESLAEASSEMDQLKQRIAGLEKELATAKEQNEKLQVCLIVVCRLLKELFCLCDGLIFLQAALSYAFSHHGTNSCNNP